MAAEAEDGGGGQRRQRTTATAMADNDNGNSRQQQQQTMTEADDDGTQDWAADYKGEGGERVANNNRIRAPQAERMKKYRIQVNAKRLFKGMRSVIFCSRRNTQCPLLDLSVIYGHKHNTIHHGFKCFTRHPRPQDVKIFCSPGSCVFRPCMRTGWVLETTPSDHYWRRYEVGQWLLFWVFLGLGDIRHAISSKKTHPNHGGHNIPLVAMVPSPRHHHIQQLANMLRDKSMLLKLEKIIVFTIFYSSYFKARCITDASSLCVCGFRQRMVLRVSYSHRAALRVLYSQRAVLRV